MGMFPTTTTFEPAYAGATIVKTTVDFMLVLNNHVIADHLCRFQITAAVEVVDVIRAATAL